MPANKALPRLPKISIESHRPYTYDDDDSCPSPAIRKYDEILSAMPQDPRPRLPQFQQSRRWARKHGSGPPPPTPPPKDAQQHDPNKAPETDDRVISKREQSFEQQRAELKQLAVTLPKIQEPEDQTSLDDDSPQIQDSTLCQHAASKCWKNVKATIFISPHRSTSHKHDARPQSRRAMPTKSRSTRSGRTADRVPVPAMAGIGPKAKQRRRAPAEKPWTARSTGTKGDRTCQDDEKANSLRQVPRSPVLSLHDPEKDSRFSKECMDILKSMDFNRDWLLTPTSRAVSPDSSSRIIRQVPVSHKHYIEQENPYEKISIQAALASEPVTPCPNSPKSVPNITITSSSTPQAHGHGLQSSVVHLGDDDVSFVTLLQRKKSPQSLAVLHTSGRPDHHAPGGMKSLPEGPLLRMPSSASSRRSLKSPISAMSTDTLVKIEAQVHADQPSRLDKSHGHLHFHRLSDPKSDGPPSIPPERPLPALPKEASIELPRSSGERSRGPSRKSADQADRRSSISTIRTLGFTEPDDFVSRNSLAAQRPMRAGLHSSNTVSSKIMSSADVSSGASVKSDGSSSSTRSYTRRSISGPRAERVKEKRLRDLASSRSDTSETQCSKPPASQQQQTSPEDLQNPNVAHSLEPQPSIDQLDQFPGVPESRPPSLISPGLSRGNSRAQHHHAKNSVHQRQLSKSSSNYFPGVRPRQLLSQSNIFIVVDSDPVTTRFRAGAMSPAPSIGSIHSCSGSPHRQKKHVRRPSNLKETTTMEGSPSKNLRNRVSLYSLKSQVSASGRSSQAGVKKNKRPIRSIHRDLSTSSDESHDLIAPSVSNSSKHNVSRGKKRRRWNSNDIGHVKTLEEALDYYRSTIMKQEERLRDQADQIQMMIRVMAPMNRARGVTIPSGLPSLMDYSTTEESRQPSRRNTIRRSSGIKGTKAPKTSLGSPIDKPAYLRPKGGHKRSDSTDANSSASASASANNTDATKVSADDASMTDPLEYENHPTVSTIKPLKLATSTVDRPRTGDTTNLGPRPPTQEKPTSQGNASGNNVALHQPPPVAKIIPRGKLPEEMSLLSCSTQDRDHLDLGNDHTQRRHTLSKDSGFKYRSLNQIAQDRHLSRTYDHRGGKPARLRIESDDVFDSGLENQRDVARLSVNHVLTSTEQMDRAIEQFNGC